MASKFDHEITAAMQSVATFMFDHGTYTKEVNAFARVLAGIFELAPAFPDTLSPQWVEVEPVRLTEGNGKHVAQQIRD